MGKQGKYWLIGIIGAILVLLLAFAAAGNRKNKDGVNGTSQENGSVSGLTSQGNESGSGAMDQGNGNSETIMSQGNESSGAQGSGNDALTLYMKEQDAIMAEMMQAMEDIPESGSASIDFLNGMIPHHVSAVDMAESYLKHGGTNQELKKIAEDIISVQEVEIAQMQEMIKRMEQEGNKDEEKAEAYRKEYAKMFESHSHMHSQSDNVEQAFAEGMIMHHQMAVDMAEAILDYTDDQELIQLSNAIIEAQKKEIQEMERIEQEVGIHQEENHMAH